ncbi:ABC transporter ATP-binding protein [Chitiniphilus purpureus]|uniref:ABC transporter ATP-binding protein n=1 Tax=Chitiniphilus purpureus TaxID=2981137 RepID=A0ABY6DMA0_9NEIS|nr:ABC transporter ATP-binding protein [Chitiniphilus sp. CD1]UXY15477.1 ABC transporter ATP-binding protein [Chitiniphilus sp. CD1]
MNAPGVMLSCERLTKSFGQGHVAQQVISEVSLALHAGELTLMMGPSGSGKSTFLAMLSGLLRPDGGAVQALGQDLWQLGDAAIDRFRLAHCGFIFQGFNLFASLTALENVLFPLQYTDLAPAEARARAAAALDDVGLAPRAHLRPLELSGGEKQRVAIARALVKHPQLIFADEPTSALDGSNGSIVVDLLHRIARERGTMVLVVTHDPRLHSRADRIIELEDGRIRRDERIDNAMPADAGKEGA